MARPTSIKDETIVAAAREVFLERGIQATTAEVAERAGVSEGSVFKRFKTKSELFRAAMGDRLSEPAFLKNLPARVGQGDLHENLFALGMEILGFFRDLMPLTTMAWPTRRPTGCPRTWPGPTPRRCARSSSSAATSRPRCASAASAARTRRWWRAPSSDPQRLRLLPALALRPRRAADGRRDVRPRPGEPPLGGIEPRPATTGDKASSTRR